MTENEFILYDRKVKIESVVRQYGEDKFIISYSGGKDSTVLSELVDMAIPDNKIPRVYSDTGIEYSLNREFVYNKIANDNRFIAIQPKVPIKEMLEQEGYPFKSKEHSQMLCQYQKNGINKSVERYLYPDENRARYGCPKCLKYQFTEEFELKVSDKCCDNLKKRPIADYQKEHDRPFKILGMRAEEGGNRNNVSCLAFKDDKLYSFNPLIVVKEDWMNWFVDEYNIELSKLYYPPYDFTRSGCRGCPFNLDLQKDLNIMKKLMPNEYKASEIIWKPVYEEYRRIGYRLKKHTGQMDIFDYINLDRRN